MLATGVLVNSFGLPKGLQTSLHAKLQHALEAINADDKATACSDLAAFINEVRAQSGKKLSVSQANQLIAAVQQARTAMGC